MDLQMGTYVVQSQPGVLEVDIAGTMFKPGDKVELREDVAKPLLDSGKIVSLVVETEPAQPPAPAAPSEPSAPAEGEVPPAEQPQV